MQGDSGGPLSIETRDPGSGARLWLLAGIISWGPNGCGEKHSPGVYTRSDLIVRTDRDYLIIHCRIPSYTQWIQKNIRYSWSMTYILNVTYILYCYQRATRGGCSYPRLSRVPRSSH